MAWHCCAKLRRKSKLQQEEPLWNSTPIDPKELDDMGDSDDVPCPDHDRSQGIIITSNNKRKHHNHTHHFRHSEGNPRKRGIKQLMYQIPVRQNFMDKDYLIYAGYRVQHPDSETQMVRTDIGVDFTEDQPRRRAFSDGAASLVRPRGMSKNSNIQYVVGSGYQSKRTSGRERTSPSPCWQRGDRVILTDTKEMVEILDRGLKDDKLVVKIIYLEKSDFPGLVVELTLLELMTSGNLVGQEGSSKSRAPVKVKVDVKTKTNRLSSPQPYYRKYSKPVVHGLLQTCFGLGSQSGDTTDARSCDAPRFRPLTRPWYSTSPVKASHLSLTKLLNDPEEFQRKRLFFENFYIATERGLKQKPNVVAPVLIHLDNNEEVAEVDEVGQVEGEVDEVDEGGQVEGEVDEVDEGGQTEGGDDTLRGNEGNNGPMQSTFISEGSTENELYVTCIAYMTMNQGIEDEGHSDENGRGEGQNQLGTEAIGGNVGDGQVNLDQSGNQGGESKDSLQKLVKEEDKAQIYASEVEAVEAAEADQAAFEADEAACQAEFEAEIPQAVNHVGSQIGTTPEESGSEIVVGASAVEKNKKVPNAVELKTKGDEASKGYDAAIFESDTKEDLTNRPSPVDTPKLAGALSPKRHSEVRSPSPIPEIPEEEEEDDQWEGNQGEGACDEEGDEGDDWGEMDNGPGYGQEDAKRSSVPHNVTFTKQ